MTTSEVIAKRASNVLPGGVASSARQNKMLGRAVYFARGKGSRLWEVDGTEYIDLCTGFGATVLGHGHPAVVEAVKKAADLGLMMAMENEYQYQLAEKLAQAIPCIDMVRFTCTGTETTYYAVKLARSHTGRKKILKFEGHFHGFNDYLAYNYWPPLGQGWPKKVPAAEGMLDEFGQHTLVIPWNEPDRFEEIMAQQGDEIAAVIMEPINYNSGGIHPLPGYLDLVRRLTTQHGSLLIFDEILSGFKTGPDCAQGYLGVTPDLCALGKAVGGGTVLSVFGGKREVMSTVAPLGPAQHSGTYNGHLIPMLAGNAFMDAVMAPGVYEPVLARCDRMYKGMDEIFKRLGVQGRVQGTGLRFSLLFGPIAEKQPLVNYSDTGQTDWDMAYRFFGNALKHGIYMHTMWHHGPSLAHTDEDVDLILERFEGALRDTKEQTSAKTTEHGAKFF